MGLYDSGATNSSETFHETLKDPALTRTKGCVGESSTSQKKRKWTQCSTYRKFGHNKQTCSIPRHHANMTHSSHEDFHNIEFSDDSLHNDLD
ncbi:unnamed protein product [Lathyrus sativus]|nr:unnamed protein product [Lathyrus sativus]